MAGFIRDRVSLDGELGNAFLQLRDILARLQSLNAIIGQLDDATLKATGTGSTLGPYTDGEVSTIRAALLAADKLAQIAHAQATQSPANDFFFDAKNLTGWR